MDAVPEYGKKWLASFLARVPPDTTWGKVQAAPDHGPGPPETHTTANIAHSKPPQRQRWTRDWLHRSCARRDQRDKSRGTPAEEAVETTGQDEDRGGDRAGNRTDTAIAGHGRPTGHHADRRRTPDTCGPKGGRIGEAKNPGPGGDRGNRDPGNTDEQGEIPRERDGSRRAASTAEQGETPRGYLLEQGETPRGERDGEERDNPKEKQKTRKYTEEPALGELSRLGQSNMQTLTEHLNNPDILALITGSRFGINQVKKANECVVVVALAWADTMRKESEDEAMLHYGMRCLRREWDSEASSSQEEQDSKPSGEQRRTPGTCGLNGIRIGEAKNPGPEGESQRRGEAKNPGPGRDERSRSPGSGAKRGEPPRGQSQSSTSIFEQDETTRGTESRSGGEDPNHKRERRAASEPTRTKRAKTLETEKPQEARPKVFPIFRESYLPKETLNSSKPEKREEEEAEEEADTTVRTEGDIPTHIQLLLKDGATVNLYMCRPNSQAKVRWQSGRVRTETEGRVQTERYTGTDGKDPVEQLKNGCIHTTKSSAKQQRRISET
jgi:hypothetical protein